MKTEKEKPIGQFSRNMAAKQRYRDKFFKLEESELIKERNRIVRHIVMLESIKVSQKDRAEMEARLYDEKRTNERKLKNIYGQY